MNEQTIQIIITACGALVLTFIGKFYQAVVDWFIKTFLGGKTREEIMTTQNIVALTKLLGLYQNKSDLKVKYKDDAKIIVARSAEAIVNLQRVIAKTTIDTKICCADSTEIGYQKRLTLHEFKSAGESLRSIIIKRFMDSVDINGFNKKTPQEWQYLLLEISDSISSLSEAHYDTWYINDDVSLEEIQASFNKARADFSDIENNCMNKIRDLSINFENNAQKIQSDMDELIDILSKPMRVRKQSKADK